MPRFFQSLLMALALLSAVGLPASEQDGVGSLPLLTAEYCTACHLPPPPDAITREHWPKLFDLMKGWIAERRLPFDEEEYGRLLALYEEASPESFPPPQDDFDFGPLGFVRGEVGLKCEEERAKITNVTVTDLDQDGQADVLVSDDVTGRITWLKISGNSWEEVFVADIVSPAKTTVLDYNGDGHLDIAVASLGFISPTDDLIGSVWLLVNRGDLTFEPLRLVGDIARVTDVKPGDFNGDGKTDFIVTAFGWRESGEVILLEQVTPVLFLNHSVVRQNGAMQVEVVDLDGDRHTDFVVMFSQQHESIEWFRNDGSMHFERRTLAKAPHPAFGSSSIRLVDLDSDGDLDILHTNGDMMDEVSLAKPYHGIRWLENVDGAFTAHELLAMPGCYCAVPCDLDGDGDLDIVVSSLNFNWVFDDFPSLIWLENDGSCRFTPHTILYSPTNLPSIDVGDLNQDGLLDIIVGGMHLPGPLGRDARLTAVFATGKPPEEQPKRKPKTTPESPSAGEPPSRPTSAPDR